MVVEDPNHEENRNTLNIRLRKLIVVALLLLVIGVLLFSLTRLFSSNAPSPSSPVNTVTNEEILLPEEDNLDLAQEDSIDLLAEEETPLDEVLASGDDTNSPLPSTPAPLAVTETGKLNDGGYWIQLGAYSSEKVALANGSTLVSELELETTPFIEKINESGKALYRLRLGPYPDRSESERILALAKIVDGFSGSFIVKK